MSWLQEQHVAAQDHARTLTFACKNHYRTSAGYFVDNLKIPKRCKTILLEQNPEQEILPPDGG
jgi:hypothetical protein